jgi:hypothetical protein
VKLDLRTVTGAPFMGDTLDSVPLDAELLVLQQTAKLIGQASDPGIAIRDCCACSRSSSG